MRFAYPAVSILASLLGGATAGAARGQTVYPSPYTVQPPSDADRLSSEIRLLAADPDNLQALVRAGELATKLDDDTAAGGFFARAERIDPRNARVKAGEGSLLVSAERPGEALRRFAEAQALGGDARAFAADRGLAYDLIGEQDRAQRDYRLALGAGHDDETQRRYALSLGISGKRDLALAQIDQLLRKSDRGAWRARAFILAMGGDRAGAERIAISMMPAGTSQGLAPFFDILPTLRPADRAFAVHFGEVRTTPERVADARLVPPLAALGADPAAPVEPSAAARPAVAAIAPLRKERKSRRDRARAELAAVTTPPPVPLPAPPAYTGRPAPPVQAARTPPAPIVFAGTARSPAGSTAPFGPSTHGASPAVAATGRPPPVVASAPVRHDAPVLAASTAPVRPTAPVLPLTKPVAATPAPGPALPVRIEAEPIVVATSAPPPVPLAALSAGSVTSPSVPVPVRSEESILASIIADIKVPGSELEAETEPPVARAATRPPAVPVRDAAAADRAEADRKAAEIQALAERKLAADKKAADARKRADARKAADEKAAAERKHDPRLLEPARVWVQVAGGANAASLSKLWGAIRSESKAFGGKSGWTTPLRATNRVLTGPFKSDEEAQAFVNLIAKDGLHGFVFASEAGQKITRLPAK